MFFRRINPAFNPQNVCNVCQKLPHKVQKVWQAEPKRHQNTASAQSESIVTPALRSGDSSALGYWLTCLRHENLTWQKGGGTKKKQRHGLQFCFISKSFVLKAGEASSGALFWLSDNRSRAGEKLVQHLQDHHAAPYAQLSVKPK